MTETAGGSRGGVGDAARRRPDFNPDRRREAREAYERTGSYREAGRELGISHTQVWRLINEGGDER